MKQQIGEILIQQGAIDQAILDRALKAQQELGDKIGDILLKLGMITERDRAGALSVQLSIPLATADHYPSEALHINNISEAFLKKSLVVPLKEDEQQIDIAMADPTDDYVVRAMAMVTGKPVRLFVGTEQDIEASLQSLYSNHQSTLDTIIADVSQEKFDVSDQDVETLKDLASEAPIVRLVNSIFTQAYKERASDIHIEPAEEKLGVRYRVDGVLREVESIPKNLSAAVVSRIKIMAQMNIAERRLAQDGRIRMRMQDQDIDMRVSTVPAMFGESVVLRLLEHKAVELDFGKLGMSQGALDGFIDLLSRRHGIILITGPTGSGKTTTLYTALTEINTPERKIITVEDPVEYQIDTITQIQVNSSIGLNFASILRSIVRQDPDIIMIGEMRDKETAEIAVQSALTGHLVLSTLHTNDAASAVTRMLDMGVEDYLLTSTINGVIGQRLVRTLCEHCREPYQASRELMERMGLERFTGESTVNLYREKGCDACSGSGYTGRTGIYELLIVTEAVRSLILKHSDANSIYQLARKEGMKTMFEDGMRKAIQGITTIEEVLRVTREY